MGKYLHRLSVLLEEYGTAGGVIVFACWVLGKITWNLISDRFTGYANDWLDRSFLSGIWELLKGLAQQISEWRVDLSIIVLIVGFLLIIVSQLILRFPDLYSITAQGCA